MPEEQNQNQDAPVSAPDSVQSAVSEPVSAEAPSANPTVGNGLVPESENASANKGDGQTLEPEKTPQNPELAESANSASSPTRTAQMGGNEPFDSGAEAKIGSEPTQIPAESNPQQGQVSAPVSRNMMRELFAKAQAAIQARKRKKLERIMALFEKKSSIANDEVEKLLHISDATATRYLEILEKESKIKQSGKTGKAVSYVKT